MTDATSLAVTPTPLPRHPNRSLIMGILGLLFSQGTLYLFIFGIILNTISVPAVILVSFMLGVTLFCAGLAVLFGHRDLHTRAPGTKISGRLTFGLIFGYGTLVVLIITIILAIINANTLMQPSTGNLVCVQQIHALTCKTR